MDEEFYTPMVIDNGAYSPASRMICDVQKSGLSQFNTVNNLQFNIVYLQY
jgi:hypothetical protein